ncbi:aspartic proteinase CDR1-like protein [Tanacetum coccineum]
MQFGYYANVTGPSSQLLLLRKNPRLTTTLHSGTTLTIIDRGLYEELATGLIEVLGSPTAQDPDGLSELCYNDLNMDLVPTVTSHFTDADVELPPVNTFMEVQIGMSCLTIVASTDIAIFGNLSQRNLLVGYDLGNN